MFKFDLDTFIMPNQKKIEIIFYYRAKQWTSFTKLSINTFISEPFCRLVQITDLFQLQSHECSEHLAKLVRLI